MFTFDRSARSIVAVCQICGAREVSTSRLTLDAWVVSHIGRAHPERAEPAHDRALTAARHRRRYRDTP